MSSDYEAWDRKWNSYKKKFRIEGLFKFRNKSYSYVAGYFDGAENYPNQEEDVPTNRDEYKMGFQDGRGDSDEHVV